MILHNFMSEQERQTFVAACGVSSSDLEKALRQLGQAFSITPKQLLTLPKKAAYYRKFESKKW